MRTELFWSEKYRPHTIADCVLPKRLKDFFQSQVQTGDLQNLLLIGGPGVGKTTVAKAMCDELEIDTLFINASEQGGIDTLRNLIRSFASTISFQAGKLKVIILDEADYLQQHSTQPALRGFIEEFAGNARFILTANYSNRIIDAIQSRCTVLDFSLQKDEKQECIMGINRKLKAILDLQGIEYDKKDVAELIIRYFPDYRKMINELQRNSHSGNLDIKSLLRLTDDLIDELISILKSKKFNNIHKWVLQNTDINFNQLVRSLYEKMLVFVSPEHIPDFILLLNKYDCQNSICTDREINEIAMLVEIAGGIVIK